MQHAAKAAFTSACFIIVLNLSSVKTFFTLQKYSKSWFLFLDIANIIVHIRNTIYFYLLKIIIFVRKKKSAMSAANPLLTAPDRQFTVGESDFAFFDRNAFRVEGCVVLCCRSGHAVWTIDQRRCDVGPDTLALLLPNTHLLVCERSDDFQVFYCSFSRDLFSQAAYRLDPVFFEIIHRTPVFTPPRPVVEGALTWWQMARFTYRDCDNVFRDIIIRNRLQNLLLEAYDKILRLPSRRPRSFDAPTRQTELFHRFVALVHEHCTREREVGFYADRLCISTRYLSSIVRGVSHGSAKEFIDRAVILEIKVLLQSTDLSIQEIAYRLHFPDQSYLGRYFRHHTGLSPTGFRNAGK